MAIINKKRKHNISTTVSTTHKPLKRLNSKIATLDSYQNHSHRNSLSSIKQTANNGDDISTTHTAILHNTSPRRRLNNNTMSHVEEPPTSPISPNQCQLDIPISNLHTFDSKWWIEHLGHDWYQALEEECQKQYIKECIIRVQRSQKTLNIYPPEHLLFNAFISTPLKTLKVVIIGQDPYHGPGQAMGLAFSVPSGIRVPPSLVNIYQEITKEPKSKPNHGNLSAWTSQGVLLLNTVLTVEQGKPLSHKKYGWEQFTDEIIKVVNQHTENIVFLLWGNPAQKKGACIDRLRHCVLLAGHPSPLSIRHFRGCDHFTKTNDYLKTVGKIPIDWLLPWS